MTGNILLIGKKKNKDDISIDGNNRTITIDELLE